MSMPINPNTSLAGNSDIPGPSDEQRKMLTQLVELMGVKEMAQRQDKLEVDVSNITTRLDQLIEGYNKLVTALQSGQQPTPQASTQNNRVAQLKELADIVNAVGPTVERIFNKTPAQSFDILPVDEAKTLMRESILGDFETGRSMRELLTSGLKKKVVNKAVTQILDVASHEPA